MFDGIFKLKFSAKCKSALKLAKVRLEGAKRKKLAVCKYLKNDIADLLKNDLGYNAYGRAEGLLEENKRLSCYNFIERCLGCVSSNLQLLQKSSECPDECRESVACLMYAAARVSEVPELRDLRSLLTERYGTSLELYVNQEFVKKFKSQPPSKEMKLQLLQDTAREFSIEWNSKALELKLFAPAQRASQIPSHGTLNDIDEHEAYGASKPELINVNSHGRRKGTVDDRNKWYSSSEDDSTDIHARESSDRDSLPASSSSFGSVSEDEKPGHYSFLPPPYTKSSVQTDKTKSSTELRNEKRTEDDPVAEAKPKPKSVRRRFLRPPPGQESAPNADSDRKINQKESNPQPNEKKNEENMIDDLLLHYSKKESPYGPMTSLNCNLKPPRSKQTNNDDASSSKNVKSGPLVSPEPMAVSEAAKGHIRAGSWQGLSDRVRHKVPDYDELAAQLEALRRKKQSSAIQHSSSRSK